MQCPRHLTRHAGKARGIGNVAVGRDLSFRNAANGGEEFLEVLRVGISVGIQGGGILNDSYVMDGGNVHLQYVLLL